MDKRIITLQDTLFKVREIPILKPVKKDGKWIPGKKNSSSGYKLLIREDTGKVISCMTTDYRKLDNKTIINKITPILRNDGGELTEVTLFADARTTYKYTFPKIDVQIQKDDIVNPQIIIRNSYDGSCQATVLTGAFRMVCANGLVVGITLSKKYNRHTIWNKDLNHIEDMLHDAVAGLKDTFLKKMPLLTNTPLNKNHLLWLFEKFPSESQRYLTDVIIKTDPKNYWEMLNVATEVATHHLNRSAESTHKLEHSIFPSILALAKHSANA